MTTNAAAAPATTSAAQVSSYMRRLLAQIEWMRERPDHQRHEEPILYVQGTPGTGKTMLIRSVAEAQGYEVATIIGAAKSPEDVGGLPIIDFKTRAVEVAVPDVVHQVNRLRERTNKPVVLFLDEASRIPEASQAAWMSFLQFREIHGHALPDDTVLALAGNSEDDDRGVAGLLAPIINRVRMVTLKPDPKEWAAGYAADAQLHPLVIATVQNWPTTANNGSPFNYEPGAGSKPFGSPRSWEAAALSLAYAEGTADPASADQWLSDPLLKIDLEATIGSACTAALMANAVYYSQLIPAKQVYADPLKTKLHDQPTLACMQFLVLASNVVTLADVDAAIAYASRSTGKSTVAKWTPLLPMFGRALARGTKRHLSGNNQLFNKDKCQMVPFFRKHVQSEASTAEDLFA